MTYRSMAGLGLLEMTPTGVRSVSEVTCVSQAEHDEAVGLCAAQRSAAVRGLGVEYKMSGRLAAFPPCSVADSNICPTPTCIDAYTAGLIANCTVGKVLNPEFDCVNDPAAQLTAIALSKLPFCPGAGLPDPPQCFTPDFAQMRSYCAEAGGDNKDWNVLCWLGQHDPAWWAKFTAAPLCAPTTCPPGHSMFKGQCVGDCSAGYAWDDNGNCVPMVPAAPTPTPYTPPVTTHVPTTHASSTSAMWGILALLAVGGGGYYMYRKYKK
jgi:hypothetical protein